MRNYTGYTPVLSKMALHGGGHLQLKKMHKVDFWELFGIRLGRCPGIIPEKICFLQFYFRFNPNALALFVNLTTLNRSFAWDFSGLLDGTYIHHNKS